MISTSIPETLFLLNSRNYSNGKTGIICKNCQIVQINTEKGAVPSNLQVFMEAELKAEAVANMRLALKFKAKSELHNT